MLNPVFQKDGLHVDKSLDWIDLISHDKSYCGDKDLMKSLNYSKYDGVYRQRLTKRESWLFLYKPLPVAVVAASLENFSGYDGFDVMLDDNDKSKYHQRTMVANFKKALIARRKGNSFLWSVHISDHYHQRSRLCDMFEEAVYESGTSVGNYTTRYSLSNAAQEVAVQFMQQLGLVGHNFVIMHIRRAVDALKYFKCKKAFPEDIENLIVRYTRNCSGVFPRGHIVAFHTDEYDPTFLVQVAIKIQGLGFVPVHVDALLDSFLKDQVRSGRLAAKFLNNYFIYSVIRSMRHGHQWLLDIHHPKGLASGVMGGSCESGSWHPGTCIPVFQPAKNYERLWLLVSEHVPRNRTVTL